MITLQRGSNTEVLRAGMLWALFMTIEASRSVDSIVYTDGHQNLSGNSAHEQKIPETSQLISMPVSIVAEHLSAISTV